MFNLCITTTQSEVSYSVAVLGRVVEKCVQQEQSDACEHPVEVTDTEADQAQRLNADDLPVQELRHAEVNTAPSGQGTEETLKG